MKWNDFAARWLLVSLHNAIFTLYSNTAPYKIVVVKFQVNFELI